MAYPNKKSKISKIEAAKFQLIDAITLFFKENHPVTVHTVIGATSTIIEDLLHKQGLSCVLKDSPMIRPERKNEWQAALNKAKNFFKHADRDPEDLLEFNSESNVFALLETVYNYNTLTEEWPPQLGFFQAWFILNYPHLVMEGESKENALKLAKSLNIKTDDFSLWKECYEQNFRG